MMGCYDLSRGAKDLSFGYVWREVWVVGRLIIGSPTHGGKATAAVTSFLNTISPSKLADVKVAAFDTRMSAKRVGILGYAAGKIMAELSKKGGTRIGAPAGFIARGRNSPAIPAPSRR